MIQMYNNNSSSHADPGAALENLRESLRRCAIDETRWASVSTVSAVLAQAGVKLEDPAILRLGGQAGDTETLSTIPKQKNCEDGRTMPNISLVCWVSIMESLEEGIYADVKNSANLSIREESLDSTAPPRPCISNAGKALCVTEPQLSSMTGSKFGALGAREKQPDQDPEATPESKVEAVGGSGNGSGSSRDAHEDKEHQSEKCVGFRNRCLQQGLRDIGEGLREVEHNGVRLSPRRVQNTMRSIREILETQAGVTCEHLAGRHELSHPRKGEPRDDVKRGTIPPEALYDCGINHEDVKEVAGRLAAERLVCVMCAASKRGHVSTLKDLAEHVDLRSRDAFGRNALYYSCLCGHVRAVHFVVVHAYGGIEGIPERERWECHKNALSAEIRHFLDTGILFHPTRSRALKSDEERPVQVAQVGGKSGMSARRTKCSGARLSTESADHGSSGADRKPHEEGSSASCTRSAASSDEAVLSVASLFGDGIDRGNNEDY
ncbi:unnamed protein product [Scytosiphon promiscuus]